MKRYATSSTSFLVQNGKLACLYKGLAFCETQIRAAVSQFRKLTDCKSIGLGTGHSELDNDSDDVDESSDADSDCSETSDDALDEPDVDPSCNIKCLGNLVKWEFSESQATLDGRNGSNACSVIALIMAKNVNEANLTTNDISQLTRSWKKILYKSIRVGNMLYDRLRGSLPHRYLSAVEAATVSEPVLEVSLSSPFPVRVTDPHSPSTLEHHLLKMFEDAGVPRCSVFIANGKSVLFAALNPDFIILVDTHCHNGSGSVILLGRRTELFNFISECQNVLSLSETTFGNIVSLSF